MHRAGNCEVTLPIRDWISSHSESPLIIGLKSRVKPGRGPKLLIFCHFSLVFDENFSPWKEVHGNYCGVVYNVLEWINLIGLAKTCCFCLLRLRWFI